jgi:hypothetical protein
VVRRSRNFRQNLGNFHFWLPLAAGVLLCVSLGILTYRMGKHGRVEVVGFQKEPPTPATSHTLEVANRAGDEEDAQLARQNKAISELRRAIAQQGSENAKLKAAQLEQQEFLRKSEEEKKGLALERDRLAQELAAGEQTLRAAEKRLNTLDRERSDYVIHSATLEAKVAELSGTLNDKERMTSEQQELLAKDRDIRELMGARDLYITEVYDVARTGETEKAFGRVFYTKGKSLIFYAYDLNDQPGLKQAKTFEAWGRRGPEWTQAFKLGMFYEDNMAKKRWVLKFNDKKTLEQIDAVFVTVEPKGGSERPTGKPLLFAYLKAAANHP